MRRNTRRKRSLRIIRFLLIVIVLVILGRYGYIYAKDNFFDSTKALLDGSIPTPTVTEAPKLTEITISAIGDVALGQDHRFKYGDSMDYVFDQLNGDYNYFFSNVADIFTRDDITIANLETALTAEETKAEKYDYGNNYWFKGDSKYANILKAGNVDVVSLANNHTYDYEQKGYDDTKAALSAVGIGYFGYDDIYEAEIKGIKIGMAGFNELGNVEQGTDIEELKTQIKSKIELLKSRNDFVIVNFHWGKEYAYEFTAQQQELAHFTIDSGADLILGGHPHVIQGVEMYKDRYIVYSLANFCFGGNKNPPDYDTFIYQQKIVFNEDKTIARIEEPDYIPCFISGTKNANNYQPVLAEGSEMVRILEKINMYSVYKMSEEAINNKVKAELVKVNDYIPNIIVALRYSTTNNVAKEVLYNNNDALLQKGTADKLKRANEILNEKGYKLKLWDAYRPASIVQTLWDKAEDKSYFADPAKGSNHTRACSVDVTLTDMEGKELEMPSDFDDMTGKGTREYKYATDEQRNNAQILEKAMVEAGFRSINSEWWHFDDSDYKNYELIKE